MCCAIDWTFLRAQFSGTHGDLVSDNSFLRAAFDSAILLRFDHHPSSKLSKMVYIVDICAMRSI